MRRDLKRLYSPNGLSFPRGGGDDGKTFNMWILFKRWNNLRQRSPPFLMEETIAVGKKNEPIMWRVSSQVPSQTLIYRNFTTTQWPCNCPHFFTVEETGAHEGQGHTDKIWQSPSCPGLQSHPLFHCTLLSEYELASVSPLINQIGLVDESDSYDCLNFYLNLFCNWETPKYWYNSRSLSAIILFSKVQGKLL